MCTLPWRLGSGARLTSARFRCRLQAGVGLIACRFSRSRGFTAAETDCQRLPHSEAAPSQANLPGACRDSAAFWSAPMVLLAAGGAAVLLPYALMPVIPGTDYANHLARLAVLGAPPGSAIRGSFAPHWALMPNLGLDLVFMALRKLASPDEIMRICLVGGLAAMLGFAAAIQRSLLRTSSISLVLMPLCVAGLPVVMGYVNFVMGCGLVMAGAWLSLVWRARIGMAEVLALALLGAGAWLCHVASFALLMVFIFCTQLWPHLRAQKLYGAVRAAVPVLAIALPGLLMSALAERETVSTREIGYGLFALRTVLAPAMATGTPSDYTLFAGILSVLILFLRFGRWQVAPAARAGLCVLVLAVAALPWQIGAATDVGSRLAVPVVLLGLAASRISLPDGGRRLVMAVVVLLIVFRDASLLQLGQSEARTVVAFRVADRALPEGAMLMSATDERRAADCARSQGVVSPIGPKTHLAAYATIDRGAWEPFIFAAKGKQPIRSVNVDFPGELPALVPPSLDTLVELSRDGGGADTSVPKGWPARFGYLLVIGRGCTENPIPSLLKPMAAGPGFALFSVLPQAAKG